MSGTIQPGVAMQHEKPSSITRRVAKNHFLRETLVILRMPKRLPRHERPLKAIAEQITKIIRIKNPEATAHDYEAALKEAICLGLIEYKEDRQMLCLTQQAVEIFDRLDIVKCECGAFLVRRGEDGKRSSSMFCWNCRKSVWEESS